MRARYSAYALGNDDFILDTWAIETRPASLALNPQTRWISLKIQKKDELPIACTHNMISFSAFFIEETQLFELTETSTFVCRGGTWYYLEGESTIKTIKLSGNGACPCGSGKKCKRCCIRN